MSRNNDYSVSLWNRFATRQLRVDFGMVYGFDIGAITLVFREIEVNDMAWQLEKMGIIFEATYGKKEEEKK